MTRFVTHRGFDSQSRAEKNKKILDSNYPVGTLALMWQTILDKKAMKIHYGHRPVGASFRASDDLLDRRPPSVIFIPRPQRPRLYAAPRCRVKFITSVWNFLFLNVILWTELKQTHSSFHGFLDSLWLAARSHNLYVRRPSWLWPAHTSFDKQGCCHGTSQQSHCVTLKRNWMLGNPCASKQTKEVRLNQVDLICLHVDVPFAGVLDHTSTGLEEFLGCCQKNAFN